MNIIEQYLKEKIDEEILLYYKKVEDYPYLKYINVIKRWSDDFFNSEKHRFIYYDNLFPDIKNRSILDMAAGCGSFVFQGLLNGYNTYGVEPSDWKHELIGLKIQENNYPQEWRTRILKGYGEELPFADKTFDLFDSWQTFEHVSNVKNCFSELYRVLKDNGFGILNCPNYFSFYEGHYSIFWFPMLGNNWFSKLYLRIRNRPIEGLDTFHPVSAKQIKRDAKQAGFKVQNLYKKLVISSITKRLPIFSKKGMYPFAIMIYLMVIIKNTLVNFGRKERTVSLLLQKI